MDNLIKFLYCLVIVKDFQRNLVQYINYTNIADERTLSLVGKFYVIDSDASSKLLNYILNKEEHQLVAKTKFNKIAKRINCNEWK
jgi:hypothetical protein